MTWYPSKKLIAIGDLGRRVASTERGNRKKNGGPQTALLIRRLDGETTWEERVTWTPEKGNVDP
jgi:hypothetical protein